MNSKLKINLFLLISIMSSSQLMAMDQDSAYSRSASMVQKRAEVPPPFYPYDEKIMVGFKRYINVDECANYFDSWQVQHGLRISLNDDVLFYTGRNKTDVTKEVVELHMLRIISVMDLKHSEFESGSVDRMQLMEDLVKSGSVKAVKKLTERLLAEYPSELANHNEIMRKERGYDRPIFWLAAIVTRPDQVPEENYRQIERYLCDLLCPMGEATVNGERRTRAEYVAYINNWKEEQNKQLGKKSYEFTQ